jgi:hypothetical protein
MNPDIIQPIVTILVALISGVTAIIITRIQASPKESKSEGLYVPANLVRKPQPINPTVILLATAIGSIIGYGVGGVLTPPTIGKWANPTTTATSVANLTPSPSPTFPIPTDTPTETPTPLPVGVDIKQNCLAFYLWKPYAENQVSTATVEPLSPPDINKQCWESSSSWGVQAKNGSLYIFQDNPSQKIFYGFSTEISNSSVISFGASLHKIPQDGKLMLGIMPRLENVPYKTGVYVEFYGNGDGTSTLYKIMASEQGKAYPISEGDITCRDSYYRNVDDCNVEIKVDGINVTITMSSSKLGKQIYNSSLSFASANFWFGYLIPPEGNIVAEVHNLSIK